MIFNYHFVEITSLAGSTSWGEFEYMDAMVAKLEELRLKGELLADDHSVLMKCFTIYSKVGAKQTGAYRLSYINGGWSLQLDLPKSVKAGKSRKSSIKEKADALLDQMDNHQYSRDVYSRGPELKVPQTRVYTNVNKGDWLHCTFCDSNMLLPGGADKCPECGSVGHLVWADEFYPESAKSSLDNKHYTNRKLLAKAVYSDDTLQADFPQVWERIKQGEQVFV